MQKIDTCAYIDCNNIITDNKSTFTVCNKCNNIVYKCEICDSYNRSLARYCRGCGNIIKNKIIKRKSNSDLSNYNKAEKIINYPLDSEFQTEYIYFVDIYGKLFVLTDTGKCLILGRDPEQEPRRCNLLESGEVVIKQPIITDQFLYITTDKGILAYELFIFDSPPTDNVPHKRIFEGQVKTDLVYIQNSVIFCSDYKLYCIIENGEKLDNLDLISYEKGNNDIYLRIVPSEKERFITIDANNLNQYKIKNGSIKILASCNISNMPYLCDSSFDLIYHENYIYYVLEGKFRRDLINEKANRLLPIPFNCSHTIHRIYKYESSLKKGIILQYINGWLFFSFAGSKIIENRSLAISFDDMSTVLERHCLITTIAGGFDISKRTLCLYNIDFQGFISLDNTNDVMLASKFMDMVYLLTKNGDSRILSGYSLITEGNQTNASIYKISN